MPDIISCPHCAKKLRVPEEFLGKSVKCPGCGNAFAAGALREAEIIEDESPPAPGPRRRAANDESDEGEAEQPRRTGRRYTEEDELDEDDELEERRRRRKKKRAAAREEVFGPALALILLGAVGLLPTVVWVVLGFIDQTPAPPPGANPQWRSGFEVGVRIGMVLRTIWQVAAFVWCFVLIAGGFCMKGLTSRGMAMTAAIFAMVPCNACCLVGLGIGPWALTVLNRPDVQKAFN
jgi:hypothetical protein